MVDLGLTDNSRSFGTHFLRSKKKILGFLFYPTPQEKEMESWPGFLSLSVRSVRKKKKILGFFFYPTPQEKEMESWGPGFLSLSVTSVRERGRLL